MNFRFWQKESPSTTVAMEDLPDGFVDVSTPTSDYIYIPNENPSVEVLQPVYQPQEAPVHVIQKNIKKDINNSLIIYIRFKLNNVVKS